MKHTVFLTGGSGRIGKRVLTSLLARGYHVKALIHRHHPTGIADGSVEFIQGDLLDQEGLKQALQGSQIICHLAAAYDMFGPPDFEKQNDQVFDNIVKGSYNLLEAARTLKDPELFLYASTDAALNISLRKFDAPITEETELVPTPGRFYAIAKIVGETMCIHYGKAYGLPWSIIRINWALTADELLKIFEYEFWEDMLDPQERERLGPKLANGRGVFAPLFLNGDSAVDQLTDPDDTAQGFVLAIEQYEAARNNIFNIAGVAPFRYLDVIEQVANGLGVTWDSARVAGIEPYEISSVKAKRLLGYQPRYTMQQMIEKALTNRS